MRDLYALYVVLCFFLVTTMSSSFEPPRPGARNIPSRQPAAHLFPLAWIYESSTLARSPHAHPRKAWIAFAYNLRWVYVESDAVPTRTLLDFREHHCLVLDRLDDGACWGDVEREVCPFHGDTDNRPRSSFPDAVEISAARWPS